MCHIITNTIIKTDTIINTQENFFNKTLPSHFIARVQKGCVGFY